MALVQLSDLGRAAVVVLRRELRALHYSDDLTRMIESDLGLTVSDGQHRDIAEDLREKILQARRFGTRYFPRPRNLAVLEEWFGQATLLNAEYVRLDCTTGVSIEAATEAALRAQFIHNKFGRSDRDHAAAIARGYTIEKAVARWFERKWPYLFIQPDNDGLYEDWCGHDFKLKISRRAVKVDVAGPNRSGLFGAVRGKPDADLHVIASDEGLSIAIHGVVTDRTFRAATFGAEATEPITKLQVLLNCEGQKYDYFDLAQAGGFNFKVAS